MRNLVRNSIGLLSLLLFVGCQSNDDSEVLQTLEDIASQYSVEIDNVIACAVGTSIPDQVVAYAYPRPGSTNLRFFATASTSVDKDDYANYTEEPIAPGDFFNGYLMQFEYTTAVERWVIISFEEDGKLHLSNPIRLKHLTQNTIYSDNIVVDEAIENMPRFSWTDEANTEDAIYFQVVSNSSADLLSGTYTFDTHFTYYDTSNIVLNITQGTPPELNPAEVYEITVMGVSEDNWVNIFLNRSF